MGDLLREIVRNGGVSTENNEIKMICPNGLIEIYEEEILVTRGSISSFAPDIQTIKNKEAIPDYIKSQNDEYNAFIKSLNLIYDDWIFQMHNFLVTSGEGRKQLVIDPDDYTEFGLYTYRLQDKFGFFLVVNNEGLSSSRARSWEEITNIVKDRESIIRWILSERDDDISMLENILEVAFLFYK